jgi:hypothetical protein
MTCIANICTGVYIVLYGCRGIYIATNIRMKISIYVACIIGTWRGVNAAHIIGEWGSVYISATLGT